MFLFCFLYDKVFLYVFVLIFTTHFGLPGFPLLQSGFLVASTSHSVENGRLFLGTLQFLSVSLAIIGTV